jgi:hypothetical protein
MGSPQNLVGKTFGKLKVVALKEKPRKWVCVCSCGIFTEVITSLLNNGNTKSCGCLKKSVLGNNTRTHGLSNSRLTGYANRTYGIWQAMRGRCMNPNNSRWNSYGGRGITICKRWNKFENFLADMGEVPKGLTIERKNVNGNYTSRNCKWATWEEQAKNKRKKHG